MLIYLVFVLKLQPQAVIVVPSKPNENISLKLSGVLAAGPVYLYCMSFFPRAFALYLQQQTSPTRFVVVDISASSD